MELRPSSWSHCVLCVCVCVCVLPQVTFQACDIGEARFLYDQLAVICPIMVSVCVGVEVLY